MADHTVHVYTDNRNLLYVFAPMFFQPTAGKHILSKVQRWVIFISQFRFLIKHVEGIDNVFADILIRWARGFRVERSRTNNICALTHSQSVPAMDEIILPNVEYINMGQQKAEKTARNLSVGENGFLHLAGKLWIPKNQPELKWKLIIITHCGSNGHRWIDAAISTLLEKYYWPDMNDDVRQFEQDYIHYVVSRNGEKIPIPLA